MFIASHILTRTEAVLSNLIIYFEKDYFEE